MRLRFPAVTLLAACLAVVAWPAAARAASTTPSSYGQQLVTLVNQARAQHGLAALAVTSGTSEVSLSWAQHLAAAGSLSHNPDLTHDLETHGSPDWTAYGENVGNGPTDSPDTLFQAYMNSPEHRDNILSADFRYVGVGVVFSGNVAWNTLDFVDSYGSARTASAAPAPPAPPAKAASAPAVHRSAGRAPVHHVARLATRPAAAARHAALHPTVHRRPNAERRAVVRARPVLVADRAEPPGAGTSLTAGARLASVAMPVGTVGGGRSGLLRLGALVIAVLSAGFVALRWTAAVR